MTRPNADIDPATQMSFTLHGHGEQPDFTATFDVPDGYYSHASIAVDGNVVLTVPFTVNDVPGNPPHAARIGKTP